MIENFFDKILPRPETDHQAINAERQWLTEQEQLRQDLIAEHEAASRQIDEAAARLRTLHQKYQATKLSGRDDPN